jgi:hypothetical protein
MILAVFKTGTVSNILTSNHIMVRGQVILVFMGKRFQLTGLGLVPVCRMMSPGMDPAVKDCLQTDPHLHEKITGSDRPQQASLWQLGGFYL